MRQFVDGKWIKYDGVNFGSGVAPLYLMERYFALPSSGLKIQSMDSAQEHWLIGQEVAIDILVSYQFANKCPVGWMGSLAWIENGEISITLKNVRNGQTSTIFYNMGDLGMTGLIGEGIIPLRFYPEEMGLAPGRPTLELEIEAYASYGPWGPNFYQHQEDLSDDNGTPWWSSPSDDSKSIEKNGDRPYVEPTAPCYEEVQIDGELPEATQVVIINIIDAKPVAAFSWTIDPPSGEAPLHVAFTNLSQSPTEFPITNARWYFGDGAASTSTELGFTTVVPHIYEKPGTYTVRLVVTNSAGSAEEHWDIVVGSAAVSPVFVEAGTYLPEAFYPGVEAVLKFNIKNNGGAGNIWLKSTCKGVTKTLIASVALDAYIPSKIITMPAHNLEWYAGYKPTLETAVTILFEVGPVGGTVTANRTWETFETPQGDGHNCPTGYHWDETTQACIKDTTPTTGTFWSKYGTKILLGAGATSAVVGAVLLVLTDKKKS